MYLKTAKLNETKQKIKVDFENEQEYLILCIILGKNHFPMYRDGEFGRLINESIFVS